MSAYTASATDTIAPGVQPAVTELTTRIKGTIAACGEAALAVVLGWTQGRLYTADDVAGLVRDAIPHGASQTGVSNPSVLSATAADYGVQLQSIGWPAALKAFAGQVPILLEIGNASALGGSDVGVKGHFITVVGKTQRGNYIVSDPNTPQSTQGKYVQYTPSQIAAAQPSSAQIVRGGMSAMAQNQNTSIPGLSGVADAINNLTKSFSGIASFSTDWLANPWRIVKLVMGLGIIGVTLWAALNIKSVQIATQVAEGVTGSGNPVNRFSRLGGTARGLGARPPQPFAPKSAPASTPPPASASASSGNPLNNPNNYVPRGTRGGKEYQGPTPPGARPYSPPKPKGA